MTVQRPARPSAFARGFARLSPIMDARGAAEHRAELVVGLSGSVIEIGCGPGAMFRHYPPEVSTVLAIEPDDYLRGLAEQAALATSGTAPSISVVYGRAEALSGADGSVDAVVCSLVLCSVPDQAAVLAEIRRVLRPGGELRFYEHVRSRSRIVGWMEDALTPLWRRSAGGCHPNRDTASAIDRAGFEMDHVRRFGFAPAPVSPRMAHIVGVAHAPDSNC